MGVDSGLPDFRGTQGFWRAYPALGRARIAFEEIANPAAFRADPALAWGFYGHRLDLYRRTQPHAGFAILKKWAARMADGGFVFTSNVDGQFQKAGFDPARICEVHGSIHHLQCAVPCSDAIWSADGFLPEVDAAACRLRGAPPRCPHCGGLARPNILMFGDTGWVGARSEGQQVRLDAWRRRVGRLLVVELGAGLAVPTVRWFGESLGVPLLRINPDAPECGLARALGLPLGASAALAAIDALLG
ncbi:NAD-dependent deacetylase [Azospira restricta]|uniref:protein acetyllysine N-acetyltransferase n=2 Tax=Azospira restricta TaxID=404405 RepID=A0A974Y5W2_9RHOO|nr:NAD-dependent deacetylase [Azospira restricta]